MRRDINALFGCHISEMNFILGGFRGKSEGNDSRTLKKPPSLRYMIAISVVRWVTPCCSAHYSVSGGLEEDGTKLRRTCPIGAELRTNVVIRIQVVVATCSPMPSIASSLNWQ